MEAHRNKAPILKHLSSINRWANISVVSHTLGNLLRCLSSESPRQWDFVMLHVEFSYDNSKNRSTQKTPFEIVYGTHPSHVLDCMPISESWKK